MAIAPVDNESSEDVVAEEEEATDIEENEGFPLIVIVFGLVALIVLTVSVALGLDWFVRRNQSPSQPDVPDVEQPLETNQISVISSLS